MTDSNWCFENPEKAAQEIVRLQELCKKAVYVANESQGWNWLDEEHIYIDEYASNGHFLIPEMQSLVDKLEEIKNAL